MNSRAGTGQPGANPWDFDGLEALECWTQSIRDALAAATPPLPPLGPAREHQEAAARLQQLLAEYLQHQSTLARHWASVQQEASTMVQQQLTATTASGDPPPTPRALYDLWIDCAETAFGRVARSASYAGTQAAMVNAFAKLRIEQRRQLEVAARQFDLPTRAELDGIHARLDTLTKELRSLRQRLDAGSS